MWSSNLTHVATHQATAVTSSTNSIATFADELKETFSRMDPIPDNDWPPSIGRHESNLVMIEHERDTLPGAKEAKQMQRDYVGGKVDSIAERKKEIRYEDIFDFKASLDKSKKVSYDSKHFRMLIDGAPGVGKTTLCRKFCKDWGAGQILKQFSIVSLLNLREERIAKAKSLDDLFQHDDEDLLREIVQHMKKTRGEGNLLVCDGFDELSEKERTRHSLFLDVICGKVLPNCSVIVSSRPYASQMLQKMKSITHHVEIVGFTKKQIKKCIWQNIADKPKAEELIEQLKQRLDIFSLCYTPLNAAITLYVYRQEEYTLPTTLTQLYTLYILHSLKRSVEIHFENLYSDDISDLKNLPGAIALPFKSLCKMAYNGLQDDQLGFSTSQLPQSLQGCPGCKGTKPDLLGLMSGSKSFTGSNAEVSYQFTHLTIQEFLAAWYAAVVLSTENQSKLFIEKAGDDRFRIMLLFLAGITGLQDPQVYQQILHNSLQQQLQQEIQEIQQEEDNGLLEEEEERLQLLHRQLQQLREQRLQDIKQLSPVAIDLKENFFLYHLVYESQNTSLSPILAQVLANAVQQDGKLKLSFYKYDLFQCTVVAYFLSTCNFPWKHLKLDKVTDEKMEVIHQVCCEHAGSSGERGAQNRNAENLPPFLKDTQELSLHYLIDESTPLPKPTSFSYLLNMKLTTLEVSFGKVAMSTKYCSIIFNVLTHHVALQNLEIITWEECAFDIKECKDLLKMLKTNTSLQYLRIGDNILSDLTAEHIAAGLIHNHSLKKLDISWNNITSVGATSIFRALVSNTTLESLCMWRNKLQSTPSSPSLPTSSNNTSPPSQLLAQPTPALSTTHYQPLSPSPSPHDGGVGAAMADMLLHNSTLTELNVLQCGLTPQSCVSLFKALKHNSSLKTLIIGNKMVFCEKPNTFDEESLQALADMLSHNRTLTELNVSECRLTLQSCVSMFKALKHNSSLKKLNISKTSFDQAASEALADILSHNSTLTELNVSWCGLTPQSMFKALKHNSSLKKLIMGSMLSKKPNKLDQAESEALSNMLSCNQSLTELDISDCGCQPKALARGLLHNTTLTKVYVRSDEKHSIMAALVNLRREEGLNQQPDLEVARCGQVLRYVCDPRNYH